MPRCVLGKKKVYRDIYRREVNSRGQVSGRQPSRNAALLQQEPREEKEKRRSGRAVAHAGLEEEGEETKKK